ncbi:pro-resilin [Condylostylus longicornis]|uniref:pro-resilin n=1 Tax=Condylostylus longicornis TaxID=2530218 RepID=UPI00244DB481|nr:pro-resilin [Condylostylus longicornis]
MVSSKFIIFISCIFTIIGLTYSQIAPGSNTYLPPKPTPSGYNYPSPPVALPTPRTPLRPAGPGPKPPAGPPAPPRRPIGEPGPDHVHMPGMPFDFEYAVNDIPSSNDYSHKANSDGDITRGEYRVQLPDGRTQVVRYTADWKTGYHAEVSYEGEPQFPTGPGSNRGGGGGYKY